MERQSPGWHSFTLPISCGLSCWYKCLVFMPTWNPSLLGPAHHYVLHLYELFYYHSISSVTACQLGGIYVVDLYCALFANYL